MLRAWVFSMIALAPTIASARPEPQLDFWRELIDPHADEVGAITMKARELMSRPDHGMSSDTEWAVDQRARFYRDARNMLAHARKLSPQNVEVLALYGRAADELGDTKAAIAALEAAAKLSADKPQIEIVGRLGAIYIRLGDLDTALRWLRLTQGPLTPISVTPIINLANVHALRGDTAKAIDVLAGSIPSSMLGNLGGDITLAQFALAVLYDRDEQRASAFAMLDQLQSSLGQQYGIHVLNELARLRLPHAEDIHYYRGLLYESVGQYVEARAEFALYAASGDTPWRRRALAHVAAIDAQRRANPGAPQVPQSLNPGGPTTPLRRRRIP